MNLVKWYPWKEMETFPDLVNRLFDDSLFPAVPRSTESGLTSWKPVVDIYDHEDKIVITAELPGVDKKDIRIDLKDGVLTLEGERSHGSEVKEESYYRKERFQGKFHRAFTLREGLDPEKIKADYRDGVLKIEIPKPEAQKPKKIAVH
jgi:HSP20 family protein